MTIRARDGSPKNTAIIAEDKEILESTEVDAMPNIARKKICRRIVTASMDM